jgi:DNA-binding GntR family transcriptional regulator
MPNSRLVEKRRKRPSAALDIQRPSDTLIGRTLANDVWHRLRADIISGLLEPAQKLRFEVLRKVYSASFPTIREALARLQSEGLVIADAQRGFAVAPISLTDLEDLLRVRIMIDTTALRESISQGGNEWKLSVRAAFVQMDRLGTDPPMSQAWLHTHKNFHMQLLAACHSPLLVQIAEQLYDKATRYHAVSKIKRNYTRDTTAEHQALMEAALRGDADLACQLLESHYRTTASNLRRAMGENTLPLAKNA